MLNNTNEMRLDNKSGIRGVFWDNYYSCWKAELKVDKVKYTLGSFSSKEDAAAAREAAYNRYLNGEPVKTFVRPNRKTSTKS